MVSRGLEAAYVRLAPHIPSGTRWKRAALARSLALRRTVSGKRSMCFQNFFTARALLCLAGYQDGKLYHGRVLDYMTAIGLQDASTTFVVQAQGQIPFVNVGYAGFIGSVSGMNVEKDFAWGNGRSRRRTLGWCAMATLMRRGLEECSSLAQVKELFRQSPRTCEYYYVFADGEDRSAVGVALRPDKIEFIDPGNRIRV